MLRNRYKRYDSLTKELYEKNLNNATQTMPELDPQLIRAKHMNNSLDIKTVQSQEKFRDQGVMAMTQRINDIEQELQDALR